jgi:hypothetical protein
MPSSVALLILVPESTLELTNHVKELLAALVCGAINMPNINRIPKR